MWTDLLNKAFETLASEAPWHHNHLKQWLSSTPVYIRIGQEQFYPGVERGQCSCLVQATEKPPLTVLCDPVALEALLDGHHTLLDAIRLGVLHVQGPRELINEGERQLQIFMHGLVRTDHGPMLLHQTQMLCKGEKP